MNYLCLDIGNVLVDLNLEPFRKALSKQMNISKFEADQFLSSTQRAQDVGLTTIREELATHFRIRSEYILDELDSVWLEVVQPNWDSITFFGRLMNDYDLKVALLSNIGFEHVEMFNKKLNCSPVYTSSIHHFSCEIGCRKPSALFFKTFLDMHPEFKGALYLDDIGANVIAGTKMGLNGMEYDISSPFFTLGFEKKHVIEHFKKI